jgi:hypothetical protein
MPRVRAFSEMGVSGTPVYGRYVHAADRSVEWQGQRRWMLSSEIAVNVSIVAAGIHYFLNLVARPAWTARPALAGSTEARELAELLDSILEDLATPWPRVVRRSGMYKFHGFSIQEWIAVRRPDGHIGLRDIESRPQHTIEQWDVSPDGAVLGVFQRSPQTGKLLGLPRGKVVYIVDDTLTDSPEGIGVFRHLLEPYRRLKVYLELEARAFERDLRGIPVGRAPLTVINEAVRNGQISQTDADSLITGMESFIQLATKESNTGLLIDSQPYESTTQDGFRVAPTPQWDISLLQGSAAGLGELAGAINRLQREMARIIGTEALMLGDQGGNRALSLDKSRNLYMSANAVLHNITTTFEKDIIGPVWALNGFPDELRPTMEVEDVAFRDVVEISGVLKDLAVAGAPLGPDDPVIHDIRDLMGVSSPPPVSPELMGLDTAEGEDVEEEDGSEAPPPRRGNGSAGDASQDQA